ncbi:MAG: outer membrane beta-barrel family protein [Bacteroidota bacterium]|nr:outer membrane beta-barrel family protein [Bacteroidota bacterium]
MKPLKSFLVLSLLISTTLTSLAGSGNGLIRGKVYDKSSGKPVEFASVILLSLPDSAVKKTLVTDSTGIYAFNVPAGDYFISTQLVGYKPVKTNKINLSGRQEKELAPIFLENFELKEVTVTAKKPFIEQKADRTVMNVGENISSVGESAYELLKKAPGVYLDKDDNIILRGKDGVTVMINDKPTHLSAKDLANYLKGMQSAEIDKVEIITNPPARYDAAGNSGIINIRTKINLKPGLTGSVYSGVNQGKKTGVYGGGNLNFRYGKLNIFGNYNPGSYAGQWHNDLDRTLPGNRFYQNVDGDWRFNANSFNAGVDYDINKQNTVGILIRGYGNTEKNNMYNNLFIYSNSSAADSTVRSISNSDFSYNNMSYNLNFKSKLDTLGKELNVDMDYARFNNRSTLYNYNYYYLPDGTEKRAPLVLQGKTPSKITVHSAKVDYVNPFLKYFRLETGAKYSRAETDNNLNYQNLQNGNWVYDPSRSNEFDYKEDVLAGYISFSYDKNKISLKAGLRAENTWSQGNSITMNRMVKRSYLDLFPTFFVQDKLSDSHSLGFSYSRRIDRPNYQDLNPFMYFIDQYTYMVGNPFLNPQYTHTFSLTHSYKNALTSSLSYSHTSDVMTEIIKQDDVSKVVYQTKQNINSFNNFSLNINYNLNPVKWFSTNNNFTAFYNRYEGEITTGNQTKKQTSCRFNTMNKFSLPAHFSYEISGFYQSKMLYGMFRISHMYSIDMGLEKNLWDNKASLKLSVRDVFKMMKNFARAQYDNVNLTSSNSWDSRVVTLNFSYRFGKSNLKPSRQRSTGIDDEQGRVGKGR